MNEAEQLRWRIANQRTVISKLRAELTDIKLAIEDVLTSARYNEAMGIEIDEDTLKHLAACVGEEWPR